MKSQVARRTLRWAVSTALDISVETQRGTVSGRGNQYTDEMPSSWIPRSHRENNTSCGGAMISQAIKENKSNLNNSGEEKMCCQ